MKPSAPSNTPKPSAPSEPTRLAARPHHGRFPIPYITVVDEETGRPDFRAHDLDRRRQVAEERRCQLCGEKLDPRVVFIGFQHSVLRRTFGEPPMHRDCMEYAFAICPWLAGAERREGGRTLAEVFVIRQCQPAAPRYMGVYVTDDFAVIPDDEGSGGCKWLAAAALEPVQWRDRLAG